MRASYHLSEEQCQYRDEGCRVYPSCLNCPLPRCIYDEPGGVRHPEKRPRDQEIAHRCRSGETVRQVAHRFKLSERTVYRILKRSRR